MSSPARSPASHRLNVLTLDGGGVRGLSSLLILRVLMRQINSSIKDRRQATEQKHRDVQPHEIFDLVAGTSTGGLIAIMLGKLGMTVEDCLQSYNDLSTAVFGKVHIRGKLTGGLGPTRYSGSALRDCVRGLVGRQRANPDLPMISSDSSERIACAVVCREHLDISKYSHFRSRPVCICSHIPCPDPLACSVCDAARATSAAPTYFPAQLIADRCFVDGGMEYNNPSFAIFEHYTDSIQVASSKRLSFSSDIAVPGVPHSNLDFSTLRFINIGTGTKTDQLQSRRRDTFAKLLPSPIRMGIFLKTTLTEFAVESEKTAQQMAAMARISGGCVNLKWERFSADTGLCYIKLDKYKPKHLERIERLTQAYLETPVTQKHLHRVGEQIAEEYLQRHTINNNRAASPAALTVPPSNSRPPTQSTAPNDSVAPRSLTLSPPLSPQTSDPQSSTLSSVSSPRKTSGSSTRQTTPEHGPDDPSSK